MEVEDIFFFCRVEWLIRKNKKLISIVVKILVEESLQMLVTAFIEKKSV